MVQGQGLAKEVAFNTVRVVLKSGDATFAWLLCKLTKSEGGREINNIFSAVRN